MKKIVISVQNSLLSEAIELSLRRQGQFSPESARPDTAQKTLARCLSFGADILLMEATFAPNALLEKRLEVCRLMRGAMPGCKIALLCDEEADPVTARKVKLAKQAGQIDAFFFSSVTASYIAEALDAL